jgi:hypothetical protein
MQASDGQCHEGDSTGRHAPLRETAAPETRRVTTPPLAPAEPQPSAAPHMTYEAGSTAVIEALVIAALHALEVHVRDVKKRIAILPERVAEGAESPAVTAGYRGTPRETTPPRCAAPQPLSRPPRRAEPPRA